MFISKRHVNVTHIDMKFDGSFQVGGLHMPFCSWRSVFVIDVVPVAPRRMRPETNCVRVLRVVQERWQEVMP